MARNQRSKGTGSLFRKSAKGAWIACYWDHAGKRREHSTRTTDRQAAERILTKLVADTALRRDLVIDPRDDRFATEGRRPLTEHVAAYIAHCRHAGQASHHVAQKETQLEAMIAGSKATRLADLTADALELHLSALKDRKLAARSVNFARQIAVAFYGWCVKTGRAESNPLRVVPKQDEARDRRRVRRPLTDDEMTRLLAVARERGRDAWYLAAALAGLRKGDMQRLTWGDVNFAESTVTIRHGKAKRTDTIPMHPQLAEALRRRLAAFPALPTARVWSDTVGDVTRLKDFLRAGIARRVDVLDAEGKPVKIGTGKRERVKTRIVVEDDEGRVIDLHALRTTLGTQLARAGVTPQVAQRIMRHGDYRTTLKHYTVLGLTDTAAAMDRLPGIAPERQADAATGTTDTAPIDPQLFCQQLERGTGQNRAASRGEATFGRDRHRNEKPQQSPGFSRDSAEFSEKRARRIELPTFSLGTPGLTIKSPVNLATFDVLRVRLHTGLHKPAHDRDSRPRARPATLAHGRPGPALAPIPGRRQPAARRATVARRGRLRVYIYRIRDDAVLGEDSVDVDAPRPRRYSAGGGPVSKGLREQPRGETEFVSRGDRRFPAESARLPTWGRTCPHVAE